MTTETITERVRAMWAEVLNVKTIADRDHFVELGGDSIAATVCINAVNAEFDVEIPQEALYLEETSFIRFALAVEEAVSHNQATRISGEGEVLSPARKVSA